MSGEFGKLYAAIKDMSTPSYLGHALVVNCNGLVVAAQASRSATTCEAPPFQTRDEKSDRFSQGALPCIPFYVLDAVNSYVTLRSDWESRH